MILLGVGFYFDRTDFFPNGFFFLLLLLAALVFFVWHSTRMKFVSVDSDNLYAAGFFRSVTIPLREIQYIHYSPGLNLVIVRPQASSAHPAVAFMPTWANGFLATFGQRSIVDELRQMAQDAASRSPGAI
jgi:hypothetical protein